jgi:hypothetical protein
MNHRNMNTIKGQPIRSKTVKGKTIRHAAIAAAALLAAAGAQSAFAKRPSGSADVTGVWTNINPGTGSIVKVEVTASALGTLKVHGYGACSPSPCDWGSVYATGYAFDVTSASAESWYATYRFGFKTERLTAIRLSSYNGKPGDFLQVIGQSKFAYGDGRYDYATVDVFQRDAAGAGIAPAIGADAVLDDSASASDGSR